LGNEKNQDVHLSYPLHPYIHRAYKILEPYFIRDVIVSKKHGGHGLLCDADQYRKVLNLLPDCAAAVRETLEDKWSTQSVTPLEKWNDLKKHVSIYAKQLDERFPKKAKSSQNNSLEEEKIREKNRQLLDLFCVEVVLRYTYPRLDINVSKMRNHLLKSPFCVHPKTGRVCVPISKAEHRTFDPFAVPTISQIVQEYFVATKAESAVTTAAAVDNNDNPDDTTTTDTVPNLDNHDIVISKETKSPNLKWEHTSLNPYYTKFQKEFLIPLMKESQLQQRHNVTDRKDAERLDF
jgi:DNA primase small subunit